MHYKQFGMYMTNKNTHTSTISRTKSRLMPCVDEMSIYDINELYKRSVYACVYLLSPIWMLYYITYIYIFIWLIRDIFRNVYSYGCIFTMNIHMDPKCIFIWVIRDIFKNVSSYGFIFKMNIHMDPKCIFIWVYIQNVYSYGSKMYIHMGVYSKCIFIWVQNVY